MKPSQFAGVLCQYYKMENQIAYIDESGNSGLDFEKEGASTHFIVTAIIIDRKELDKIESQIEVLRKKYFQTGEIKSSNVADNDTRRISILKEFDTLNYHVFSIVIDKRELKSEGFNYKTSFYKFLHSLVDRELFKIYPNILVVADEHGGQDFKKGFIKYIEQRHIPDLFKQAEFKLSNSKSELIVQLADFISGTIARCYDEKKLSARKKEFLDVLKSKIIEIRLWPTNFKPFTYEPGNAFENYDETISKLGLSLAGQFIKENAKSNVPFEVDQCSCVRFLMFYFLNINPETYVSTYELIGNINAVRNSNISMHYFRSKIIAKLRDKGVILSSSNKGYKLPSNNKDLYAFVNHSNSYIQPMIDRVLKCRDQIRMATKNEVDILDHEEFKYLSIIKNNI